ncbi:MAG: hypothetical protein RLZZ598_593 [Pseudomonadota bacterium]
MVASAPTAPRSGTVAPLAGLKVLDFSSLLPGPFATHLLSDLGADVIRVEAPGRPDLLRMLPPHLEPGISAAHATLHRGKRSITLDLKQAASVDAVKRLVPEHDIVLESFRPGVMDRLGLGYAALKQVNPALIYVSLTGYGQTGPMAQRAGHDINYLALAGALGYSGSAETGPALPGIQVADLAGALFTVTGLLAAVLHRHRTGEGQHVDVSITDAAFTLNALMLPGVLCGAPAPQARGTELNGGGLYDCYRSRDGRWFAVGSLEPAFARALMQALGLDLALLPGLFSPDGHAAVRERIRAAFAAQDASHWLEVFAATDACVEPVLDLAEAAAHPQLVAREMVIEVPGPSGLPLRQSGCAIRFSRPLPAPRFAGCPAGAHNAEILRVLS